MRKNIYPTLEHTCKMLMLLCLIATALPLTLVEGAEKYCVAALKRPGIDCFYGSTVLGFVRMLINYNLTPSSTEICCQARACSYGGCLFVDIGCHNHGVSKQLIWELPNKEPSMSCYTSTGTGWGRSYKYTAAVTRRTY
ncbi:insoluble matrix shell protein 3-like [Mercenaria mercenaria]|uniref:insoluble matrix shell protein 3-like n=1 Tax=Mercenaria mercenaria TaxID=6596 RepID=UPI00234F7444|nr:insoluble matrix shell protein 3-like [Mercenaria mercenaria]